MDSLTTRLCKLSKMTTTSGVFLTKGFVHIQQYLSQVQMVESLFRRILIIQYRRQPRVTLWGNHNPLPTPQSWIVKFYFRKIIKKHSKRQTLTKTTTIASRLFIKMEFLKTALPCLPSSMASWSTTTKVKMR